MRWERSRTSSRMLPSRRSIKVVSSRQERYTLKHQLLRKSTCSLRAFTTLAIICREPMV